MKINKITSAAAIILAMSLSYNSISGQLKAINNFYLDNDVYINYRHKESPRINKIIDMGLITTTAYNPVKEQTDGSPCIGAMNINVCDILDNGGKVCATNFVPIGTIINVEGYGDCLVADRISKKYNNRVDVLFPASEIDRSLRWGVKKSRVLIISPAKES